MIGKELFFLIKPKSIDSIPMEGLGTGPKTHQSSMKGQLNKQ